MKKPFWVIALALAGCTSTMNDAAGPRAPEPAVSCPLGVPETSVAVVETAEGAALVLITSPQHVDELRERARDAAAMHGPGMHVGKGHEGTHGHGGQHGLQAMQLPPAHAVVVDVKDGARIDLTPADRSDRIALVTKVRVGADRMREAGCR